MNKEQLLALAKRLGIIVEDTMTVAELTALIAGYTPPDKTTDRSDQGALPPKTADVIFHKLDTNNMTTFSGYKVVFIAGAKHGLRLVLRKGDETTAVYVYPESVTYSGVKTGDVVTILAERTRKNDKEYWNATALSVQE